MKNLKIRNGVICSIVAALVLAGGATCITLANRASSSVVVENEVGMSDISFLGSMFIDKSNFAVLNVGDHDSVGVHFQDRKMEFCNDKDISLGIIVSSSAKDESDIYDDIEYVKGILSNHSIDFPVYLNIDNIMMNADLNSEMQTKLIKSFLEKCSANEIYVGLYGTDTNLCRVSEYCGITGYDSYLVMDKPTIKYDGTYSICKNLDGDINSKVNLAQVISESELNLSERFVNDGSYTFGEDDDIIDVALKYGMSVNELLEFNGLSKKDIVPGVKLRIPSIIDNQIPKLDGEYELLDEPIRGCDLSYAQGTNIDWDKMAEDFEFIILKCTEGLDVDSCFENNVKNCSLKDIPVGVYCYNEYDSRNCDTVDDFILKQELQAEKVLETLKNKNIEFPVYFDIEPPNGVDLKDLLDKDQVVQMLEIWCDEMEASGYIPGIYSNMSTFSYLQSCVDYDLADKFQIWIAGGDQYGIENIDYRDVVPSSVLFDGDYGATVAQSTDQAKNAGAGDYYGRLDINFSKVDYANQPKVFENDPYEIKGFVRPDWSLFGGVALSGAVLALGAVGAVKLARLKHQKKLNKTL